jgi:glutaredoxin
VDRAQLDGVRARAWRALGLLPGRAGELARRANDALGRPLADAAELAERRELAARLRGEAAAPSAPSPGPARAPEVAPVVVYHMDKTRRDAARLTEILDSEGVPYRVSNLQEDPAAQAAVRRDSKGHRLPVVFIAGEAIGGRAELASLAASGDLARRVFGEARRPVSK